MNNKLLNKYRSFSPATKASFWFVVSNVLLKGISFITLPIFSRLLSTEQYGVVSLFTSWEAIVSIFCTLTLWGGVFNIVLVKHNEEKEKYMASFQGMATTITIVFFIITIIFIKPVSKFTTLSPFLICCLYVAILSSIPFNLWAGWQRYEYKYKKLVLITIVISILNPVLSYLAVINTEYKAEARILVGVLINLVLGFYFFIKNLIKGKTFCNINIWKFAISFNIVLIPHYLSMQVLSQSDRIMINNLCNTSDTGIYSVAYTFGMLLTLITNGINSSFTPFIYKQLKEKNYKKIGKTTNVLLIGLACITILMLCIIPDFFKLLLPESYYSAIWCIPPIATSVFFMFLYPLFGSVEFYYEEKKYVTIASICGALLNIILNYVFINFFGFLAAAYTSLFCYISFSLFHFFAMKIVLKKRSIEANIYDMKKIILISLILILGMIGLTFLYNNIYCRWGVIIVVCIGIILFRKKIVEFIKIIRR